MKYEQWVKLDELSAHYRHNRENEVKRFSYRAGGIENAEDVVQEAYTRAITYLHAWDRDKTSFGQWFSTVLDNALRDFKREERQQGLVMQEDKVVDNLELEVDKEKVIEKMLQEIEEMPLERNREILRLFVVLGYQAKEVAQILEANVHTVRKVVADFYKYAREVYA